MINDKKKYHELIRNKLHTDQLDFIGFAISPWHVLGLNAEINSNKNLNQGIIFIMPHAKDGFIVDEHKSIDFQKKGKMVEIYYFTEQLFCKNFSSLFKLLFLFSTNKKNQKKISIISPVTPYLSATALLSFKQLIKERIEFIILDEGIGTYASKDYWEFVKNKEGSTKENKFINRFKGKLANYIKGKVCIKERFLFNLSSTNILIQNEEIVGNYRNVITENSNYDLRFTSDKNTALIITQPIDESDIVDADQELNIIHSLVEKLNHKYNNVVIRMHPREERSKYDSLCELYPNLKINKEQESIEMLVLGIKPVIAVGFNSTALLTLKILFNIPSYSIENLIRPYFIQKLKDQSIYNEKLMSNYITEYKL